MPEDHGSSRWPPPGTTRCSGSPDETEYEAHSLAREAFSPKFTLNLGQSWRIQRADRRTPGGRGIRGVGLSAPKEGEGTKKYSYKIVMRK